MKGVLWVRVSSEPQSRGYSPDVQLRELREAAARRSIEVIKEFKVSESAKTSETRKKFRELLAFIEEHKPEYLIAYAVDRITRNPDDLHTIHRLIESGGLRVFIVGQNKVIDKDSQSGDKFTLYSLPAPLSGISTFPTLPIPQAEEGPSPSTRSKARW